MKEVKRIARDAAGGTRLAEDSGPEVLDRRAGRAAPLEDEVAAVAGEAFLDPGGCRRPGRLQPRRSNRRCTRRAVPAGRQAVPAGRQVVPAGRRADRTGVVCTAALDVAGVTREAIVADYAQIGERPQAVLDRLSADPPGSWPSVGRRPPEEASRPEPGERREQDAAAGLRRAGDTYARSSPTASTPGPPTPTCRAPPPWRTPRPPFAPATPPRGPAGPPAGRLRVVLTPSTRARAASPPISGRSGLQRLVVRGEREVALG